MPDEHNLYPLLFRDHLVSAIWGGQNLQRYGKSIPPGGNVAEAWEVWQDSLIANGSFAGQSLAQVTHMLGAMLLGTRGVIMGHDHFPLLLKLIDATDKLSVQLHPSDDYAAVHENGSLGKSEAWYVLHAEPGALMYHGLKKPETRHALERAILEGTLENHLRSFETKAGDIIYVPAGTIHAIGAGVMLAEIQETSTITYRLYDWNRVDAQGHPRELHVQKGLDVIDPARNAIPTTVPPITVHQEGAEQTYLLACRYFSMERITFSHVLSQRTDGGSMHIILALDSPLEVHYGVDMAESITVSLGSATVIPAGLGPYRLMPQHTTPCTILRYTVPDLIHDIIRPLEQQGIPRSAIAALGGDPINGDLAAAVAATPQAG